MRAPERSHRRRPPPAKMRAGAPASQRLLCYTGGGRPKARLSPAVAGPRAEARATSALRAAGRPCPGMISASRSIARLALALGALSLREAAAPPPSLGAVEALIEAAGPIRPLEARLTGGFRYAACAGGDPAANRRATACDGSFPVPGTDWKAFSEAAKRIAGEAARRPSAAAWHGLGLLRLITSAEDDRAVAALQASAETSGRPAASLSDLAAAYVPLAQRRRAPCDLLCALPAEELDAS